MACEQEARCGREGGLNISEGRDALQCVRTEGALFGVGPLGRGSHVAKPDA